MYRRSPRQGRDASRAPLILSDLGMLALCITAVFWLLVSPLVPYDFTYHPGVFLALTIGGGLALGAVGIWLNHLAARAEGQRPIQRRPRR